MTDNSGDMPELKGCPFCGFDAHIQIKELFVPFYDPKKEFYAECGSCHSRAGHWNSETKEQAAKDWNTRAPSL